MSRVFADRDVSEGVAGKSALNIRSDGVEERSPDAGFLMGAAGIGLVLLAAMSPIEPEWNRVLLAAIPGRAGRLAPEPSASARG